MFQQLRGRVLAAALVVPMLAAVAACSDSGKAKAKQQATTQPANQACPASIKETIPFGPPSDVPSPGVKAYQYSNVGKTQVWFFAIDGTADKLPSLRDAYDKQLTDKGYKIEGTDQEEGAEAESDFSGPHDGTTNFRPLCTGKVVFRLKLTS